MVRATVDANMQQAASHGSAASSNPELRALQMSYRILEAFMQVCLCSCPAIHTIRGVPEDAMSNSMHAVLAGSIVTPLVSASPGIERATRGREWA